MAKLVSGEEDWLTPGFSILLAPKRVYDSGHAMWTPKRDMHKLCTQESSLFWFVSGEPREDTSNDVVSGVNVGIFGICIFPVPWSFGDGFISSSSDLWCC